MQDTAQFLLTLGGILLLGLATDTLGRHTMLPRVTLLLIFGAIIGHDGLDLIPELFSNRLEIIADMALLMVGFLLGGKLTAKTIKTAGKIIVGLSVGAALGATVLVVAGLIVIGVQWEVAIILGCIAAATAPAASVDIVMESKYKGLFANLLLAIVALDDVWGLIVFSIGLAAVSVTNGMEGMAAPLIHAIRDIGGATLLGVVIGVPAAYFTGRIKPGEPILTEALGLVFLCGGLAVWLEVSFLIASMVMGAMIANLAKHHDYPFHAIEGIEWPFLATFFVLAGASLEVNAVKEIGLLALVYIGCRAIGKIAGAWLGGKSCGADMDTNRWMGVALLPQAGVAMGMALVASNQFPQYRQLILPLVISTTIIFEIVGPVFARLALNRVNR